MAVTHGMNTSKKATSVSTPVTVASGVHFAVGAAPVQMVGGKTNEVIMLNSYEEAVQLLGYSDDWGKYDLCMEMYTAFVLYKIAPVFMVNVLDPEKHKVENKSASYTPVDNQVTLPLDVIADTVEVSGKTKGTDYEVFYTDTACVVEFAEDTTAAVTITSSSVDPSQVTKADVIGGYSVANHKTTGLELIDSVFPKYTMAPDLILCPNWSHDPEVAAVMAAKGENINGVFEADAVIDLASTDNGGATYYTEVPALKKKNNISHVNQLACWPKVKLGDRVFNYAVQLAGSISATDNNDDLGGGTPCESASNKTLQADSMVLASGEEVTLDVQKANYLNDNGIITALNFYGGFVSWGNYTAAFPATTDPVDYFYCINRMFKWVAKTVVLSYWNYIDRRLTRRLLDAILQGVNNWLNSLTAEEKILGGRVEMLESENSLTALMAGRVKFHIYITPPSPLQQMDWVVEYDISYLSAALAA